MTPLPPAPPPRRSPWGKVLIGCAIVGGLVVLAGVAAVAFGLYWMTSAGRHYPPAAVASPQSQGVIRVGDLAGDAGARALLTRLFTRMQEAGRGDAPQLPEWMRRMQAYQARQGISQWLPREATMSMEPDPEGVPRIVLAANMKGFVRPIRMAITQAMKGDRKSSVTRHGEHEVLNFGTDTSLCFMDGTLVVSYHPSVMEPALDRLGAASPSPSAPPDARALPGRWDLNGWLGEETGAGVLMGLLASPDNTFSSAEPPLEGLRDVRFGIDIESEDDARVAGEVGFADAASAAGAEPWLARGLADLRTRIEPSGLSATTTDAVDGDRVRFELKVRGLQAAFDQLLRAQEERRPPRPRR
ncbi:MAG TPA: hypothetical protein VFQ51_09645 [Vicinamibacteria bacterium]|nr:hypothetical protein [Vicinamibacteria bacterium]